MKDLDAPILVCLFAFLMALVYSVYFVEEKKNYREIRLPIWLKIETGVPLKKWGSGIR